MNISWENWFKMLSMAKNGMFTRRSQKFQKFRFLTDNLPPMQYCLAQLIFHGGSVCHQNCAYAKTRIICISNKNLLYDMHKQMHRFLFFPFGIVLAVGKFIDWMWEMLISSIDCNEMKSLYQFCIRWIVVMDSICGGML